MIKKLSLLVFVVVCFYIVSPKSVDAKKTYCPYMQACTTSTQCGSDANCKCQRLCTAKDCTQKVCGT